MARSPKPILQFAVSGVAGAVATFLLLTWGSRQAAVFDGLTNRQSGAPVAVNGVDGGAGGDGASTGAPASTALARMLADDPAAALRRAVALGAPDERRRAVLLVGKQWAWTDPLAALAMASTLPSTLRVDYLASVSREWANLDSDGFLGFAESATDLEELVGGLEVLIPGEPVRIYGIVSPMVNGQNNWSRMWISVIRAMAEQDPLLALRNLENDGGTFADAMHAMVLSIHGRNDPDAALAWLESQASPSASLQAGVYHGVAAADFERGFHLLTEEVSAGSLGGTIADSDLAAGVVRDAASAARVSDALLEIGTDRADQVLEDVAAVWARRDPESLVDWMIDNAAAIEPQLARSIGLGIATNDLESALGLVDRLPPAIANTWVAQIAGSYARQDPRAALDWVARYQGQAFYDEARAQAVLQAAERDPELVASMVSGLPAALQASAVPKIATAWVQMDPRAAADWVAGLEGAAAAAEAGAAGQIARSWMRRDLDAATQWALDLPRGPMRDSALGGLIGGSYGVNFDPRPIFEEIESADERRMAAVFMVGNRFSTDPELARDFAESLLDDEQLGEWARETLDRIAARN